MGVASRPSRPLMAAMGCGGPSDGLPWQAISGTVTLDGQPVAVGSTLIPEGFDGPSVGSSILEGAYSIPAHEGTVLGIHRDAVF